MKIKFTKQYYNEIVVEIKDCQTDKLPTTDLDVLKLKLVGGGYAFHPYEVARIIKCEKVGE